MIMKMKMNRMKKKKRQIVLFLIEENFKTIWVSGTPLFFKYFTSVVRSMTADGLYQ